MHLAGEPYLTLRCVPFPETFIYSRSRTIDSAHTGTPGLSSGRQVHFLPLVTSGRDAACEEEEAKASFRRPSGESQVTSGFGCPCWQWRTSGSSFLSTCLGSGSRWWVWVGEEGEGLGVKNLRVCWLGLGGEMSCGLEGEEKDECMGVSKRGG